MKLIDPVKNSIKLLVEGRIVEGGGIVEGGRRFVGDVAQGSTGGGLVAGEEACQGGTFEMAWRPLLGGLGEVGAGRRKPAHRPRGARQRGPDQPHAAAATNRRRSPPGARQRDPEQQPHAAAATNRGRGPPVARQRDPDQPHAAAATNRRRDHLSRICSRRLGCASGSTEAVSGAMGF